MIFLYESFKEVKLKFFGYVEQLLPLVLQG